MVAPNWSWFDTFVLLFTHMRPQINNKESVIAPLKEVTPLSKYLALALFVAMPFLGGYVGYTMGLEVERDVVLDLEIVQNKDLESSLINKGKYQIVSGPTVTIEKVIEILQRPAQTNITDFNLDKDEFPRDIIYPDGGSLPKVPFETLSARNRPINCWVTYRGLVHDITPLLTLEHEIPSIKLLFDKCGTDITEFLSNQPVEVGALGTARFKYILAEFYIPLKVETR